MEPYQLTTREALLWVMLINAVIGFGLGLIPLLFGYFNKKLRLGLIGYGAIGRHIQAAGFDNTELVSVLVKRPRNEDLLTHEPDGFFAHAFDAVAECAGHEAVRRHGQRVLEGGADFLVTSVGAFTDTALFDRLLAVARANGKRLILPSAGIGALDILSSAAVGGPARS